MWHEERANALLKHLIQVPSHSASRLEPPQKAPLREQVHVLCLTGLPVSARKSNGKAGLLSTQDSVMHSFAMVFLRG